MEEFVGGLWDRFITRTARRDHPEAVVKLADLERTLGILFRALGGDAGLRVAPAAEQRHGARRRWLSRVAGSDDRAAFASLDLETLRLPREIAYFPDRSLNRDLYLWLIAAAAHEPAPSGDAWIVRNQMATLRALKAFPGLRSRYERLVAATLAERLAPEAMPADEAAQEQAGSIRRRSKPARKSAVATRRISRKGSSRRRRWASATGATRPSASRCRTTRRR